MFVNDLLTVLYLIVVAVILVMIGWNMFQSKKLTDKIIGAIAIVMFVLRLLLIK
jgi:hypothetical protein